MSRVQENPINPPNEDELRKLPLRALSAFAARCAKRVQSIFILPSNNPNIERDNIAIANAILAAEDYATGRDIKITDAFPAAVAALTAAQSAKEIDTGFQAFNAASSAAEAAFSVYAAVSDLSSNNMIVATAFNLLRDEITIKNAMDIAKAGHTANFSARSALFAANATPSSITHMVNDYRKLLSLNLGKFFEIGVPIDPSETGPLGVLWPNGAPKWFAVDENHPFYDEILQFFVSTISLTVLTWAFIVDKNFRERPMNVIETPSGQARIITLPNLRREIHFIELECPEECILNPTTAIDYILGNKGRPTQLFFEIDPLRWNPPTEREINVKLISHMEPSLQTIVCYLVGGAYERLKNHFNHKYGRDWPPELQFFRHLRNACFHKNIFNIHKRRNGSNQIDPFNPPTWHTYIMQSDEEMLGKKAIDGFFRLPHILPFLYDIGKWV